MGPNGYFNTHQHTSLRGIELITAGDCTVNQNPMNLKAFAYIERFSWTGPWSIANFDDLRGVLSKNADHLERLHLDFVSQSRDIGHGGQYQSFIASYIFNLEPGEDQTIFPSLRELSLCSIAFDGSEKKLLDTLNILGLSSLALRQCPGWEDLLAEATNDGPLDSLLSLEITYSVDGSNISCIWELLPHTKSITDLYVSVLHGDQPSPFTALAKMQIRLTRLIYHTRKPYEANYSESDEPDEFDYDDMEYDDTHPFLEEDITWWQPSHPCAELQCLGLSCNLPDLV
jgi:hypothetical protein